MEDMGADRVVTRDVACLVLTLLLREVAMTAAQPGFRPQHWEEIKLKYSPKLAGRCEDIEELNKTYLCTLCKSCARYVVHALTKCACV